MPDPARRAARFRLSDIPAAASLLLTPDRRQHLLFCDKGRALQLVADGISLLRLVCLLTEAVPSSETVRAHLTALAALNDIRATGRLRAQHFPPEPRGSRLRLILQALDGSLSGAAHRDIAAALFGRARVEADWSDPGNHLRDRVRRAVHRGHWLMRTGYRIFLN